MATLWVLPTDNDKGLRACRQVAWNPDFTVGGSWGTRGLSPLFTTTIIIWPVPRNTFQTSS